MPNYKSIAYAYPTSTTATELGFKDDGCYFVQVHNYATNDSWLESGGYSMPNNPELIKRFHAVDDEVCKMALQTRQPWRWGEAK